jgi:hypothetical protein
MGPSSVVINAVAQVPDGDSIYYQDFYLPPNGLVLELGTQWM